ncbi:MAG TPA: tetratricopeptide repeat protein, partial [Pirellulales bacterium]|nr:tetratricopeptide repeat protein [Pirellulales bacterium]
GYFALANLYWSQRRFEEAFELYRIAASLEDKDEQFAHSYFLAGQCLKRTDTVLKFLRRRFERFGAKSSLPARTLEHACRLLDRTTEAQEVLERAMRMRPDDGELLLYAADAMLSHSFEHSQRADELLQAARDRSPRPLWLRTIARLAWSDGNLSAALAHWQEVLEAQPLAIDAHRAVSRLLAETQGRPEALAHLAQYGERFPHYIPLYQLWLEWLQDEPPEKAEAVARRSLEQHPDNAWTRRELGFVLVRQGRLQDAWAEARAATELEPHSDASHNLRGLLYYLEGKLADAREAYRTAIRLNVDDDYAIRGLMASCNTPAQRREALAFVQAELERQVTFGEGLLSFREHARATLDAEEVIALLRKALSARPDLWHAWSACAAQLVSMKRVDDASELIQEATVRFPLAPRLWLDRAEVCRARLDNDGELDALATAHRINPAYGPVARALSEVHSRRGDLDQARAVLKRAAGHEPLDPFNYGGLADLAWRAGDRDEALAAVERAVELHAGYEWAWDRLREWTAELGRPQHAVQVARKVCSQRPGEARSWLVLARILSEPAEFEERMAALDRALELNPRLLEAYDLRAILLVQQRRFDEALGACRPAAWDHHPPVELRSRAAWIESVRGNLDAAIAQLQECVAEEPNNWGCWQQLADWRRQREDLPRYLEAAQALERIEPQSALSLGYLGDALLLLKRNSEAIPVLKRALALAPAYEFAGSSLFDLQLEAGEFDEAAATIAIIKAHADSPRVTAREVQLAARQNNHGAAMERLSRLCATVGGEPAALDGALPDMDNAGWRAAADDVLRGSIESSEAAREVGSIWVRRRVAVGDWSWVRNLPKLVSRGKAGEQTVNEYVALLAQGKRFWALVWFVHRNRTWLKANTFAWGSVGYAWMALGKNRRAANWMADWRNRDGLEPWMLSNLASGLRELGRDRQAADVSRRAIELPADIATLTHRLWLAADAVLARQFDEATEHMQSVDRSLLADDDNKALDSVIDIMLHVAGTPPAELPEKFSDVRRRMNSLARHMGSKARRRFYHRCVRRLSRAFGWRGILWRFERFVFG